MERLEKSASSSHPTAQQQSYNTTHRDFRSPLSVHMKKKGRSDLSYRLPILYSLRFINSPPPTVFTYSKIKAMDGSPIAIELVDVTTNTRVTLDPLLPLQVEIVVLNGGFTGADFDGNILRPREGKPPLLEGDLTVTLMEGFGVIDNISFTCNSSYLRGRRFRLGVKATAGGVMEGVTEGFYCKDKQSLYLSSEVWRLGFFKNSISISRLAEEDIHTVKDLRQRLTMNPNTLHRILGSLMSNEYLDEIVSKAKQCLLDVEECYAYNVKAQGAILIFNSVYDLIKVSFDGVTFLNSDQLTSDQKVSVDILRREAYENINSFVTVDSADTSPGSSLSLRDDTISMDFDTNEVFGSLSTCDVVIRCKKGGGINYDDFTSYLRAALCRRGISVYEDSNEVDAVPECRILILLLTSTNAPSNLINIREYQLTGHLVVYPIFYKIPPYNSTNNRKNYGKVFLQDKPRVWQEALKQITEMPGYSLKDKSESELIDEIVRDASKVLCSSDKVNMIGIDMQVEEILSLLRIESLDVQSIGIWGTVGIGKTTIAEEIFRKISFQYETCVFLEDLHREVEVKGHDDVREDFLSKILEVEPHVIRISDIKTSFWRSRLQRKKVLVILDDVNDYRDVETFLGKLNYFGPGSRIIMTSRNRRVFVLCKIDHVY